MKVKRVKIGIRPPGTIFDEAAVVIGQIEAGKKVSAQPEWLYFSDVREMGKVLTPKRLELLKTIRDRRPESIRGATASRRNCGSATAPRSPRRQNRSASSRSRSRSPSRARRGMPGRRLAQSS